MGESSRKLTGETQPRASRALQMPPSEAILELPLSPLWLLTIPAPRKSKALGIPLIALEPLCNTY